MPTYLNHFQSFIDAKLPSYQYVFTKEAMVDWIIPRDNKQPRNIVEHLLKRTTNYELRDDNDPPSRLHDDLFFMTEPNSFRRYHPGADPAPIHWMPSGEFDADKAATARRSHQQRNVATGKFAYEEELQMFLRDRPDELEQGLRLLDGGVEYRTSIGLIDLLCSDARGDLVVLELKVGATSDQVAGQVFRYMGWAEESLAKKDQHVRGIIVARNISEKLRLSVKNRHVDLYEYELRMLDGAQKVIFRKMD
jgi:hypothetical protein